MTYAKLRICKLLNEELENLANEKIDALQGDPLTKAGLKAIESVKNIDAEIQSVTQFRDSIIASVKNDENFKKIDSDLQDACTEYYFTNKKSETEINNKYHITGFVKKIYRKLHNF